MSPPEEGSLDIGRRTTTGPTVAAIIFLLLAVIGGWPYFFYVLLRVVVCLTAVYLAVNAYELQRTTWVWLMGAVAVLFNPVMPVRMARGDWQVLDFLAAVLFAVSLRGIRRKADA
jgi:hypothetical protein